MVIILLLLVCIIYYHKTIYKLQKHTPIKSFEEAGFKNGDIILTRCDYSIQYEPVHYGIFNVFNFYASGGIETHAGIVVERNNDLWLYHVEYKPTLDAVSQEYKWKSPVLVNLQDYIMSYCGDIFHYPVKQKLSVCKTQEFMKNTSNCRFTVNQLTWANTIFKLPAKFDTKHKICTQLVAEYLVFMNVVKFSGTHDVNPQDLKYFIKVSELYKPATRIMNAYYNYTRNNKKCSKKSQPQLPIRKILTK